MADPPHRSSGSFRERRKVPGPRDRDASGYLLSQIRRLQCRWIGGEMATTNDRPKRSSGGAHNAVLVSGNMLAVHFGCTRQHVDQLTAQGVIERSDGKFDQDQSRLKYLAHLRSPERRSARSEAAAKHAEAKTQDPAPAHQD
jgi:hypothetical protein